ncbi:SDR family oxidoreductase [Microvirga sp. 3-52]|uniref:UDP-glucuronic acid decarboxylase family protein n=1 Tax=Microvirga sp. 3-52 TaxID=2792425 RepID=UPI001AC68B23|nr:UDP-glucuronic acid decarboxylase family protein [Microvirga sp. 3-52]MBO1908574.1 SDR family oxidoreductase [Microvirga sp. 3-52]MBS7455040.1 SDR family oxidoreductase [Microvirga sp. 3-52]
MKNGKSKHVLVAGGAGFLGSHLCDALLSDGAHVIALDNFLTGRKQNLRHLEREPRFDIIDGDIIKPLPARLRSKRVKIDEVFNLACAASPPHYQADPEHTMLTSVVGTHNLLTFAEATGARFFLASTSEIYGDPEVHPQTESYWGNVNPTGPRACYDEGKRAAETLTFDFDRSGRADVRVARIFNTYGPRMRADDGRVVSNVICQALAGDDITVYGDGSQTRSFCYVSDLVDGFMRLMAYDEAFPGAVNLGNPIELTVGELAQKVLAMTSSSSRIVTRPLPVDDPRRRRPDISLAKKLIGWSPRTSLDAGLKATISWFAEDQSADNKAARVVETLAGAISAGRA